MPRSLVLHPDPTLRRRADAVASIDASTRQLVDDMFRVMKEERGFGLAAPQVGESVRIFVTQGIQEKDPPIAYINPRFIVIDGVLHSEEEGCLSLPAIRGVVRRQKHAVIEATGLDGNLFQLECEDWHARGWQHEMDHLEGILIIDRMTPLDRLINRKRLRALEARATIG